MPAVHAEWTPELVDELLWEIAAAGGQVRKGYNNWLNAKLAENGITDGDVTRLPIAVPAEKTVRTWKSVSKRDRYEAILKTRSELLDDRLAGQSQTLAIAIEEAERQALSQTMAGLAHANGVEASTIMRNLSQSKKIQVEAAAQISGRRILERELPNLLELGKSLAALGVATLVSATGEPITDADAIEVSGELAA